MKIKLFLTALLCMALQTATAQSFYSQGVWYSVLDDEAKTAQVARNRGASGDIVITATVEYDGETYTVVKIGYCAFTECEGLTSVSLPSTIEELDIEAFSLCKGLKSIALPNSLKKLGDSAFNSSGLESIVIPGSVTEVGSWVFSDCAALKSVAIPTSLTKLSRAMFRRCSSLEAVEIPTSIVEIEQQAFMGCTSLTSIDIPTSVTTIGNYAFYQCGNLQSVALPNSVTSIGQSAFNECTSLQTVALPAYLPSISKYSFYGCTSLTAISIPNSVTSIGASAFEDCANLASVAFGSSVKSIGSSAFSKCGLTELVLPSDVDAIGSFAFFQNQLETIAIGPNVAEIGIRAFANNGELESVSITAVEPPLATENTFDYYGCPLYVSGAQAVKAYSEADSCWNHFSVQPMVEAENVEIAGPEKVVLQPGQSIQLTATVSPADVTVGTIFWRSTNPEYATVDNDGLVTCVAVPTESRAEEAEYCQIIAETLYSDCPVAVVTLYIGEIDGLEHAAMRPSMPCHIYNMQGVCLKRDATGADIEALPRGIYVIGGKKVARK